MNKQKTPNESNNREINFQINVNAQKKTTTFSFERNRKVEQQTYYIQQIPLFPFEITNYYTFPFKLSINLKMRKKEKRKRKQHKHKFYI